MESSGDAPSAVVWNKSSQRLQEDLGAGVGRAGLVSSGLGQFLRVREELVRCTGLVYPEEKPKL